MDEVYNDKSFDSKLNEAIHYFGIQRYERAAHLFQDLLAEAPQDGRIQHLLAYSYYCLDRNDDAIENCKISLENGFSIEENNYLLGRIYMDLEKYATSEKHFLESFRINPVNTSALAAYGMLMLKTGFEKKATQLLNEALRISPENPVVLHYKLIFYMYKNNKDKQISILQSYIKNAGDELARLLHIGLFNMHNNNYKEARENFRQAFLMKPTDTRLLEILKQLDRECSILFLPQRFINKIGAPLLWFSFFTILATLTYFKYDRLATSVTVFYLLLVLYSFLYNIVYLVVDKIQKK